MMVMAKKINLNGKWIEVCRVGVYHNGQTKVTQKMLKEIVADYDPGLLQAPVVLDHNPYGKAYGWVEAVKLKGKVLLAKLKEAGAMNTLVNAGEYKTRSISFYRKLEDTGRTYLKHLSFLGAGNPAVKGLQPAFQENDLAPAWQFSDHQGSYDFFDFEVAGDEDEDLYEDDEEKVQTDTSPKITDKKGSEEMALTEAEIKQLIKNAQDSTEKAVEEKFTEQLEARDAKITELEENNDKTQKQLVTTARAAVSGSILSFREKMESEFKLPPALGEKVQAFMLKLAESGEVVKLSDTDKDGKVTERDTTLFDCFKEIITGYPAVLKPGVIIPDGAGVNASGASEDAEYSDEYENPDAQSILIDKKVKELMKADTNLSEDDALLEAEKVLLREGKIKFGETA
jgi:hypothetical protein